MSKQASLVEKGIYLLETGQYKISTTALDPKTNRLKKMRSTLPKGATLEEARALREQMQSQVRGEPVERPQRTTLGEYALAWIERRSKRLAPSAERAYRTTLATAILPLVGDIYCDALRRSDIEEWVATIERATYPRGERKVRYAHDTLRKWHRVMVTLCGDMAADLNIDDPCRRITAPRSTRRQVRERGTLSSAELAALLESARGGERYAEIVTLAYTGMRSGELWALRWEDLDGELIHVRRTVSDGMIRDCTKTGWERDVYAHEVVREALSEYRQRLMRDQDRRLHSELVFPSLQLTPRTCGSLNKALKLASAAAGISQHVSPQVLRRTFNTLLLAAGVNEIVLRAQMGHSDAPMTARYAGVRLESKRAAIAAVFEGVSTG